MKKYTQYSPWKRQCWVCDKPLSKKATGTKTERRKPVHTKTCSGACRKALSRMQQKEDALGISLSHFKIEKCDTSDPIHQERVFVRV